MYDAVYQVFQTLALTAGAISLIIWSAKLGKAIGYMETILKIHTEEIKALQENKVDREVCEAYRESYD